jgi:hypothetical protein
MDNDVGQFQQIKTTEVKDLPIEGIRVGAGPGESADKSRTCSVHAEQAPETTKVTNQEQPTPYTAVDASSILDKDNKNEKEK